MKQIITFTWCCPQYFLNMVGENHVTIGGSIGFRIRFFVSWFLKEGLQYVYV